MSSDLSRLLIADDAITLDVDVARLPMIHVLEHGHRAVVITVQEGSTELGDRNLQKRVAVGHEEGRTEKGHSTKNCACRTE
jgi:hypothetical protein